MQSNAAHLMCFVRLQSTSDIILLQEWWFDEKFTDVFDSFLGDDFDRVAERRPGPTQNYNYKYLQQNHDHSIMRADGMGHGLSGEKDRQVRSDKLIKSFDRSRKDFTAS
jgi:hypothetical protein